jgi:hypothetical protein
MNKRDQTSAAAEQAKPDVEGEGSYQGARRYNEHVKKTIEEGDVEKLAEEAKRALEGDQKDELQEAERRGKRGPVPPKPTPSQR